ncbi:helix-turn-helix transcriptional regulator [Rhodococcus kroppenstedtii]|uniref:helix-turn-helix domain-containing protein n=1 Tax=Rhodococcoides kroppenstedtii TaxID=293050 RepID=UPI001C9BAD1C|nr:helix-turn-helix transcriptional regulator [Rhodococcus kroppenstedtii]MBY6438245.1 helix-turn-helix transcriptional regulator [Rhodococcus kroppenstedtii]
MTQDWSQDIVERVGGEVRRLRGASVPPLSAQALADRTSALGHPISRAVISDLETGRRKGLDVSDLLALSAALRVAPAQLLFPKLPRGVVQALPGLDQESHDALRWFGGETGLLVEHSEWRDESTGNKVSVRTREGFDEGLNRIGVTREWLRAIAAMRSARVQLQRALRDNESADQIDALEFIYENARAQADELADRMRALGLEVGEGHPRA